MNTAARALVQNTFVSPAERLLAISSQTLGVILLVLAIFASAITLVYIKDLHRQFFSELQTLQQTRDDLQLVWGQLLLEQNTWAAPARVQAIAGQELGMIVPAAKDIRVVNLSHAERSPTLIE